MMVYRVKGVMKNIVSIFPQSCIVGVDFRKGNGDFLMSSIPACPDVSCLVLRCFQTTVIPKVKLKQLDRLRVANTVIHCNRTPPCGAPVLITRDSENLLLALTSCLLQQVQGPQSCLDSQLENYTVWEIESYETLSCNQQTQAMHVWQVVLKN